MPNDREQAKNFATWANDLRTTKHRQIKGRLGDSRGGRCCLGVARDRWEPQTSVWYTRLSAGGVSALGASSPLLPVLKQHADEANDDAGLTFEEIAYLADVEAALLLGFDVDDGPVGVSVDHIDSQGRKIKSHDNPAWDE